MERSCKPAATPQGFPTSIQPRFDHLGLRRSNLTYSTTYHLKAHTSLWTWESISSSCTSSPAHRIFDPLRNDTSNLQSTHQRLGPYRAHTTTQVSGGFRIFWGLGCGSMEGAIWTRENVVGKVFPCEDQGGRGITVAVASGIATWLHCGRSPPGI
jgi:hypothetical protein